MPAAIIKGRLHKRCEESGRDNAQFGEGVKLMQAMSALAAGNVIKAKALLGKWWCTEHKHMMEG